jgi:hypothetical protein
MKYEKTKTIDYKFSELCDEIDKWKDHAEYWKKKYEEEIQASIKRSNESMDIAKKGVANALMFALSVKDDKHGNMIIEKKDREILAKDYK